MTLGFIHQAKQAQKSRRTEIKEKLVMHNCKFFFWTGAGSTSTAAITSKNSAEYI